MTDNNVIHMGEKRNRDNDCIVVSVKDGRVLVDNTDRFYPVNHLWRTRPGTIEYLQRNSGEDSGDATTRQ